MPTEHHVVINVRSEVATSFSGEASKPSLGSPKKKSWYHKFLVGTVPQRGRPGRFAIVEKFMKRAGFGDWYSEKVADRDTGELLHRCEEPLSKHKGHGSDRTQ